METTTKYPDEVISAGQILRILDADAKEVSTLCQKACLKPKKDGFGNIYFSKGDVDILRKVKELYAHTKKLQEEKAVSVEENIKPQKENRLKKIRTDFQPLAKASAPSFLKTKEKQENVLTGQGQANLVIKKMDSLENNIVEKVKDILSEKLDGLDEVIVELIRAKTENENLRQKVNDLNKENFSLKAENASFKQIGLGFYIKKSVDDVTF